MYLTRKQLAARLGFHPSSIGRLVKAGRLPQPIWWGATAARWPLHEIEEYEKKMLADRPKIPLQPARPAGRPRLRALP
jgi:predicted DNA-binding transcriptional regulator AlpA